MRLTILIGALALGACTNPRLNANIGIGSDGVRVTPSVSGQIGDVGVAVSP